MSKSCENYKTLKKETKEDLGEWTDAPCSQTGRINIVKKPILLQEIYRFNAILTKIPFSHRHRKKFSKFHMETKKNPNSQSNFEQEEKNEKPDVAVHAYNPSTGSSRPTWAT